MKISIIVPIYNVEKYVARCLQSIINQDYENIQCILVNDCTPDNSFTIAKDIVSNYLGNIDFLFVEHEKNMGLSAARNSGIRISSGEYIYFLDSDDELPPKAISYLVETLENNNYPEVVMGITRRMKADGSFEDKSSTNLNSFTTNRDVFGGYLNNDWYIIACNKLIRKDVFFTRNLYFKEGITHEDVLWSFEVSTYIKSIIVCPQVTYIYYLSDDNSISRSSLTKKRVDDLMYILERKAEYFGKTSDDKGLSKHIKGNAITLIYTIVRNGFKKKEIVGFLSQVDELIRKNKLQNVTVNIPFYHVFVYRILKFLWL